MGRGHDKDRPQGSVTRRFDLGMPSDISLMYRHSEEVNAARVRGISNAEKLERLIVALRRLLEREKHRSSDVGRFF